MSSNASPQNEMHSFQ